MTETPPPSIRYFEALSVASIVIGVIHEIAVTNVDVARMAFSAAIPLGLALLVSRGRKNWARWILAAIFLLGTGLILLDGAATFKIGLPAIAILVMLLQAIGLAFLFTQKSSDWLRRKPSLADTFT